MVNDYRLNNVKVDVKNSDDRQEKEYTLSFSSGDEEKTITLNGQGSIKELAKI